jgi:hypothetical protein
MKKLIAARVMMISCIELNVHTALVQPPMLRYNEQEASREKIQIRDLPDAVKDALEMPDYAGWGTNDYSFVYSRIDNARRRGNP